MLLARSSALIATISVGLIAGFFYAWVCSTVWGLNNLDPADAITAMNAMNASVRNAVFFPVFFLTPVLLMVAMGFAWHQQARVASTLLLAAAVTYGLLAFLPTAMVNVPMNETLALIEDAHSVPNAGEIWTNYSQRWEMWNIGRTVTSTIAFLLALLGLQALSKHRLA